MAQSIDPFQALEELYGASKKLQLSADSHEFLAGCHRLIKDALTADAKPPKAKATKAKPKAKK